MKSIHTKHHTQMKHTFFFTIFLLHTLFSCAQLNQPKEKYTLADTLRGSLRPERTCYDIQFYHLDVKIDPSNQSISGHNLFRFKTIQDFSRLQFDLFENLTVDSVVFKNQKLRFDRKFNAVFVSFPTQIPKNSIQEFKVYYHGNPTVAKRAPWDGGFIFEKDRSGNTWASVACQGLGASVWWPNKDHQSDEVDSMKISITSPSNLEEISNGRNIGNIDLKNGFTKHHWLVSNPINNYDVTFYIGKYKHWTDTYKGENGNLTLDFWALQEDAEKAKKHWDADVKPMLKSFEYWFGPYPFYSDGYKLVEAPFLGMEHQSAIAYGNKFQKGYSGRDLSGSGWGMKWDFITVHESGHEWFGNNITAKDIADMWIHESFTNYSEALFTQSQFGKAAGDAYAQGIRQNIANDRPIIGDFGVNKEGSGDMYYKGANMIHAIRQIIDKDEKFRQILRGLNKEFYHKTVTGDEIKAYINHKSGTNFDKVFEQYLTQTTVPQLNYEVKNGKLYFTWKNCVKGFDMPVKVTLAPKKFTFIYPKEGKLKVVNISKSIQNENFEIDPNFYVTQKNAMELVP